jgi:hypothetical protein
MSTVSIRAALEARLNGITPALATAFENAPFKPPAQTVPYQICHVLFARPDNAEIGRSHQELGYMQVRLMYPMNTGSSAAMTRAELIRTNFERASTVSSGGVTVNITETPEIETTGIEDNRYTVLVKIRFRSFIPT